MLCLVEIPFVSKQELETMEIKRGFCPQQNETKLHCGNIHLDQIDSVKQFLM